MSTFVKVLKLQWKNTHIIYKYTSIQSRILLLTELCHFSVESTDTKNGPDLKKLTLLHSCLPGDKKKHF